MDMKYEGYTVRFRVRAMKWKKKNGKRGSYGGTAVYLRVTGPDKVIREIYLGSDTESKKTEGRRLATRTPAPASSSSAGVGGREQGYANGHFARGRMLGGARWIPAPHNGRSVNRRKG